VNSLIQVLTGANVGFEEYTSASRDLVARGAEAVPLLVKQLPSCGDLARLRILGTLSRVGAASAPALPEVRRLLQADSPFVRAGAADCLRAMGPAGREALPDLSRSLDDSDEITVGMAAVAIDAVDPGFVGTRLKDLLGRLGTSPAAVDRLQLCTWYRIARRRVSDPALVRDLRHWLLVVRLTSREELRVGDVLGAEGL
jgi:HEAT repeat protein